MTKEREELLNGFEQAVLAMDELSDACKNLDIDLNSEHFAYDVAKLPSGKRAMITDIIGKISKAYEDIPGLNEMFARLADVDSGTVQ